jgi:hypothetical protein
MTAGDYLLWPVKALVSLVCLTFGIAVLFGEWHWGRPLAAAFFFALGAATWVMLLPEGVRRVMAGILAAGFGGLLLYAAIFHGGLDARYPQDCSTVRRALGCYFMNALHAVGGVTLVRAFWAAFGAVSVFAGVKLARGTLPLPKPWA